MAKKKKANPRRFKKAARLYLPWPVFAFVMLCIGVLLAMWTFKTDAVEYTMRAKVPAPPLSEPAVILSPSDGSRFSSAPITVSGYCPSDSYVSLFRNNVYSGSAPCVDNKFELQTDLFEGGNELLAKVFNLTDDEGPAGSAVTVYYEPPAPPAGPEGGGHTPAENIQPLVIKSDFKLIGYHVGQEVRFRVEVFGGQPPYALSVDWGDGSSSLISHKDEGRLSLSHIYKKPGSPNGNFIIRISAADTQNRKAFLQVFVLVNAKDVPMPAVTTVSPKPPASYLSGSLLKFLWPAYAVVLLMALSFWLGEREELLELRRQAARRRRRA